MAKYIVLTDLDSCVECGSDDLILLSASTHGGDVDGSILCRRCETEMSVTTQSWIDKS